MPKLDDVEGATNYANCGGASWAVSSNCKNTDLAFDFLNATFGADVDLYDDLLVNAGAIASYLPAAQSETYNESNEFYGGQAVYKDIVEFAGHVPGIDYGAYYSDIRSALTAVELIALIIGLRLCCGQVTCDCSCIYQQIIV